MNHSESGFVLLYKPPGVTSFQALAPIKKAVHPLKVGHTGTLDKFAEGLLIAVAGKATKFASYITALPKEYRATIEFGRQTDTLDPEGTVLYKEGIIPEQGDIENRLTRFIGEQLQKPPLFSAVHVNGERAHKLVRQGKTPQVKSRRITIYGIEIVKYSPPYLTISLACSKGTYVRALARDLGKACGTYGFVTRLCRTKIGDFSFRDAVGADDFNPEKDIIPPAKIIPKISGISIVHVKNEYIPSLTSGKRIDGRFFTESETNDGLLAVFDRDETFIALLEKTSGDGFQYKFLGVCA